MAFIVIAVQKDPKDGKMDIIHTPSLIYHDFEKAMVDASCIYHTLLNQYHLADNGSVNDDGDAIPGGCFDVYSNTSAEAIIYDNMECENGCLGERVVIIVKSVIDPADTTCSEPARKVCAHCSQEIMEDNEEERTVEYKGKLYHEECFRDCASSIMLQDNLAAFV